MPSIDQWGPATWCFFHTMAAKIKPNSFSVIGKQLLQIIVEISSNLPCPECATHAKQFFSKMNHKTIQTNQHMKNMLYTFHATVNTRVKNAQFNYNRLDLVYEKHHLVQVYNNFVKNYHTKGNMQMLTDSFHRQRLLSKLQQWFKQNLHHFNILPIRHPVKTVMQPSKELPPINNNNELNDDKIKELETGVDCLAQPKEEACAHLLV